MSVPEIDNFRQKFPMYNDMSDIQVATKLAQKYPAYSDLPGKVAMVNNKSNPDMQGGATSPANIKAQQDVKTAQGQASNVDTQVGINQSAYNATWPVSMMIKKGLGDSGPNPQADQSGNKMLQDVGGLVNPLVGEVFNLGGKVLGMGNKAITDVIKYSKPKAQADLAETLQNDLLQSRHKVINNYGKEYDQIIGNSDKKININPAIKNFVDQGQSIMQNPEFAQQIAVKNPAANKILDLVKTVTDGDLPEELSAKEADNLSKSIKNLPSIKSKLAQGSKYGFHTVNWTNEDRMLIGLADDIKSGVIDEHPQLSALNKDYGKFMNAYKTVAPDFKIGTTVSKLKNYSSYDPQKTPLLEGIVPSSTINRIKDFERADKTSKLLKSLGLWGVRGAAASAGFKGIGH